MQDKAGKSVNIKKTAFIYFIYYLLVLQIKGRNTAA